MNLPPNEFRVIKALPSAPLQDYVSHYWLGRDNTDRTYSVLPDGSVDVVIALCGGRALGSVYGTTTAPAEVPLDQGAHYLGISFRPGQSRHFLDLPACQLTDTIRPANGVIRFGLMDIPEHIHRNDVFARIDEILERHIIARQPRRDRIDDAIRFIEAAHGAISVRDAVAQFQKSGRQFERIFLESVGITPKSFSKIIRFRHAAALIQSSRSSLADIAALSGYADQSHMNHEFRRLAGTTPAAYGRNHVAFLQDASITSPDNERS